VAREEDGHVLEGALHCTNSNCLREYPIIDGIPLIVADIRRYVSENILGIEKRRDLTDYLESILGDCCGPNSAFEQTRQHLSSYVWDHYGDLDPTEALGEPRPGSMLRSLEIGLEAAGLAKEFSDEHTEANTPPLAKDWNLSRVSPVIDLGCSVGRSTFALAERTRGLVLGVDLHFPMLRLASEVLRYGLVRYPRRRTGLVYERREFSASFGNAENVDFWACDATALPFPAGQFALVISMNLLDCVHSPRDLLVSLGHALRIGGKAILSCPYDWSASATPLEAWLGGHSQRTPTAGTSEIILRTLLTPGAHPASIRELRVVAERDSIPWQVKMHDRSFVRYNLHLVVAERVNETEPKPATKGGSA